MMSVMEAYISNPNPCMTKDASSLIKLKPQLKKTFTLIQIHYTKSTLIIFSFKKKKKSHNRISSECIWLINFDFHCLIQMRIRLWKSFLPAIKHKGKKQSSREHDKCLLSLKSVIINKLQNSRNWWG